MRRLAIPDAAAMLSLHPSEVRALIEDGRLDAVRVRGRWLIPADAIRRLDAGPLEDDLRDLEARVSRLERRLESVDPDEPIDGVRPALQPLFRRTD